MSVRVQQAVKPLFQRKLDPRPEASPAQFLHHLLIEIQRAALSLDPPAERCRVGDHGMQSPAGSFPAYAHCRPGETWTIMFQLVSLRLSARVAGLVLLGWVVPAVWLCLSPVEWHLHFVQDHHPGLLAPFIAVLLAVVVGVPLAYQMTLRRRLWRLEPLILAGAVAVVCFFYEPAASAVCALLLISSFSLGRFCLTRFGLAPTNSLADLPIFSSVGLATFSWLLYFLGLAGWFRTWVFVMLLAAPCILLAPHTRAFWVTLRESYRRWGQKEELRHPLGSIVVTVLAVLAACGSAVMLAPSIAYDSLLFHLPLARYFAEQGAVKVMPVEPYSYYPQGVEVLMTLGQSLAGQAAAQMIPVIFFVLTLLALAAILRRCGIGPLGTLTGVVVAASVPFLHWTGVNAKNDAAVALYHLTALLLYLQWRDQRNFKRILAGVFLIAAASSVKLTALFGMTALFPLYVHAWWRDGHKVRTLAAVAVVFFVFGAVWQIRTWLLTGNPVYPYNVNDPLVVWALNPDPGDQRSFLNILLLWPWRVLFKGQGFNSVSPTPVGIALVLLLPLAVVVKGRRAAWPAWLFLGVYLGHWGLYYPELRYAIAPIALLLALLGARVVELCRAQAVGLRAAGYTTVCCGFLFSLCLIFILEINEPQFQLFSKRADKTGYLRSALLTYPSLEYVRIHARTDDWVFGVANCSRAYAPNPGRFTCVDTPPAEEGLRLVEQRLAQEDFRYLILPADPGYAPVLAAQSSGIAPVKVYADANFQVYRLTSSR